MVRAHLAMQTDESRKVSQYFENLHTSRMQFHGAGCCSSRSQVIPHDGSPISRNVARGLAVVPTVTGVPVDATTREAIDLWNEQVYLNTFLRNPRTLYRNQDLYDRYRTQWIDNYRRNPNQPIGNVNAYISPLERELIVRRYNNATVVGRGCCQSRQMVNEPQRRAMVPIPTSGTNLASSAVGVPVNFYRSPLNREAVRYFENHPQRRLLNEANNLYCGRRIIELLSDNSMRRDNYRSDIDELINQLYSGQLYDHL
jgi:hypothetical protein